MRHIIHHAIRIGKHLRARKILTKWTLLGILFFCNIVFLWFIFIHTFTQPYTFIGDTPIGLKTRTQIRNILLKLYEEPIAIHVDNHLYHYTYDRLGIYLDVDDAVREIFSKNDALFSYKRQITIPLSRSLEYYAFLEKTQIDEEIGDKLSAHFGKIDDEINAKLSQRALDMQKKIQTANETKKFVLSRPLTFVIRSNDTDHFFTLTREDLMKFTKANVSDETGELSFAVDSSLMHALPTLISNKDPSVHTVISYKRIHEGLEQILASRAKGEPAESIRVLLDSGPNTDGSIATHYIEVDISQQKMYTFKNGVMAKTYRVSTGKDYPTPTGTFKILNKATIGYSGIYNVWMPYWMAFSYSNQLHAYFGIHELPYFYSGTDKIQRPREFIGTPNTGGCIALDIGDAKEVYQFASVGMPIVVNL